MDLVVQADIEHPGIHGIHGDRYPAAIQFPECCINPFCFSTPADCLGIGSCTSCTDIDEISTLFYHFDCCFMHEIGWDIGICVKGLGTAVDHSHQADRRITTDF